MSDPLQLLHDTLGAEVIAVPEQLLLPLPLGAEGPGPEEISEALHELHSVEVIQEIPDPEDDDDDDEDEVTLSRLRSLPGDSPDPARFAR